MGVFKLKMRNANLGGGFLKQKHHLLACYQE